MSPNVSNAFSTRQRHPRRRSKGLILKQQEFVAGVVPVGGKWSSESTTWFSEILTMQLSGAEITGSSHVSVCSGVNEVMYSVNLTKDGCDVAEDLFQSGHAKGE